MLPLNDPLWKKLDDAHRDRDIPKLLSELAETWNDEAAKSLLWGSLCHQETCYGATYAVIPHLLRVAEPERNRHQRLEIALFVGFVALCAFKRRQGVDGDLQDQPLDGLPQTLDAWDRKLDCYRGLVASFEDRSRRGSDYEQSELLPRYKKVLEIESVNARDLEKIQSVRAEFFAALPAIRAVCERALLENLNYETALPYLLSGIAAADGLLSLARLLNSGSDGRFRCSSCDWWFQYILFGDRVAIYADDNAPTMTPMRLVGEDRAARDFSDGVPSKADGFMVPAADCQALDSRVTGLLSLAERAQSTRPALLLRNFLGTFLCCKCSAHGLIVAV